MFHQWLLAQYASTYNNPIFLRVDVMKNSTHSAENAARLGDLFGHLSLRGRVLTFALSTCLASVPVFAQQGHTHGAGHAHHVNPPTEQPMQKDLNANGSGTVFESYQRYAPSAVQDWKQSNDTVTRIGGWRYYASEGQQEEGKGSQRSNPAGGHHHGH